MHKYEFDKAGVECGSKRLELCFDVTTIIPLGGNKYGSATRSKSEDIALQNASDHGYLLKRVTLLSTKESSDELASFDVKNIRIKEICNITESFEEIKVVEDFSINNIHRQ